MPRRPRHDPKYARYDAQRARPRLGITITPERREAIRAIAAARGVSVSEAIGQLIDAAS